MNKYRPPTQLTVAERIRVELDAHKSNSPGVPLSLASLCRNAKVSRSTVYEAHPEIVKEVRALARKSSGSARGEKKSVIPQRDQQLQRKYEALLLFCLELQKENSLLKARLGHTSMAPKANPKPKI